MTIIHGKILIFVPEGRYKFVLITSQIKKESLALVIKNIASMLERWSLKIIWLKSTGSETELAQ